MFVSVERIKLLDNGLILSEYAVKTNVRQLLTLMQEKLSLDYGVMLPNGRAEFYPRLVVMLPFLMSGTSS